MPETVPISKAELRELGADGQETGKRVTVQFNPETLKVAFANQVVPPTTNAAAAGAGDQRGTAAIQFVGKGSTKLSAQLWFDVNAVLPQDQQSVTDVRDLTKEVAFFITPKPAPNQPDKFIPPGVRFLWGSFKFDGIMDALEETLEFFSNQGVPLRASLNLSLVQQNIQFAFAENRPTPPPGAATGPGGATPGTQPLTQAPAGASLQGLAAGTGKSWQAIASANGIENPRLLATGQLLNLNAGVGLGGSASLGGSVNLSGGASLGSAGGLTGGVSGNVNSTSGANFEVNRPGA